MSIGNTLFIGKVLHHFARLSSTNDYALKLLADQQILEGTVVSTDDQFQGKGQMGNIWQSEVGKNVTMSIILQPHFLPIERQFYLNIVVSLAVQTVLAKVTGEITQVKWSNDILIAQRKVAGILIQNHLSGKKIQHSVIGIGINVNQTDFPDELNHASSLHLLTHKTFEVAEIRNLICQQLETHYLQLKKGRYEDLRTAYMAHLFQYQKWAYYRLPSSKEPILGRIIEVTQEGKLVVEHHKSVEQYYFKEIQFIW